MTNNVHGVNDIAAKYEDGAFKGSFMKPKKKSYMDAFFKAQEL